MSNTEKTPLPDYERPPVIEVVCGIQFESLANFQATALGLFWQRIREEYVDTKEMPPLPPTKEQFGEISKGITPEIEILSSPPIPRMFYVDKTGSWLMQLQKDRFLHNWRKEKESDVYPRFPVVFGKFWNSWEKYLRFCQEEKLGELTINQLEITYINHIPAGDGWSELGELGKVFPDVGWRTRSRFLPSPESMGLRLSFALPEGKGRLHVSLNYAIRLTDNHPVLLCEMTARGMSLTKDPSDIRAWFELGREWIVRGFADIIDLKVQKECWGRKV
jgi:uncharacterized protein (TIGR04255 family)